MKKNAITSSIEDYLEVIYEYVQKKKIIIIKK